MKFFCLIFFSFFAFSAPASEESCCKEKTVGEVKYKLFKDDPSLTAAYGCKGGCIYTTAKKPDTMWCFKFGLLSVTCHDEKKFYWSYADINKTGPAFWAEAYEGCNGKSQSPIDIPSPPASTAAEISPMTMTKYDQVRIARLSNDEEHYIIKRLTNGTFKNNGHTAQLDVVKTLPSDVGVLAGGPLEGEYKILQLHFHWGSKDSLGSEHTLDGKMFPIELHIVHVKVNESDPMNTKRGLAVTGFFFQIDSEDNPALKPLVDQLASIKDSKSSIAMEDSPFKISSLVSGVAPVGDSPATLYSTYDGSLTTPGCNEVVHWINFLTPLKISATQLAMFRTLDDKFGNDIVDNFRPPQPLNGRTVDFYGKA